MGDVLRQFAAAIRSLLSDRGRHERELAELRARIDALEGAEILETGRELEQAQQIAALFSAVEKLHDALEAALDFEGPATLSAHNPTFSFDGDPMSKVTVGGIPHFLDSDTASQTATLTHNGAEIGQVDPAVETVIVADNITLADGDVFALTLIGVDQKGNRTDPPIVFTKTFVDVTGPSKLSGEPTFGFEQ